MHEWLSMVLIVPFVLHLWKNWRPMTGISGTPHGGCAGGLGCCGRALLMPTGGPAAADGPPQFQLAHLVLTQPLDHVAPALGLTAEALTDRLIAAGTPWRRRANP